MEPIFRKATNADVPATQDLVFATLREYGLKPDPQATDNDLGDFEKYYFSRNGYFELCEIENHIVGTWGIYPLAENGRCELRKMYLSSRHRGRGLGKIMMERALQKARELGYRVVELETASVLKEAIAMYVKFGFRPITNRHLAARCDQAYELHFDL